MARRVTPGRTGSATAGTEVVLRPGSGADAWFGPQPLSGRHLSGTAGPKLGGAELVAAATCRRTLQPATPHSMEPCSALAHPRGMNRRRILAVAGLFVPCLAFIGGCANPRGTATALSGVVPVSSRAVASAAVPSSAGASTAVRDSTQIYGAVTADSERQLVLTYLGGDCDISARGAASESGSAITVRVMVKTSNGVCDTVGYIRTATVPVIDGALLLRSSWLPDGYQGGTLTAGSPADGKAQALQEWTPPDTTETPSPGVIMCRATPAGVALAQGYGLTAYPLFSGNQTLPDGTPATVGLDDHGDFGLYWTPPGHPVGWTISLQAEPECTGYQPLSLDTLMRIANSLR